MVQEFKCPCCGGSVEFDWVTQNLKCPYCDTEFSKETLDELGAVLEEEEKEEDRAEFSSTGVKWEEDGSRHYVCASCGGEIIALDTEGAMACPWCGNPVVLTEVFQGVLKPDLVIPFKTGKEAATEAFYENLKGKTLLPSIFRDRAHIDEIKGVYVPVWLFSSTVTAKKGYKAKKTFTWSDRNYIYTKTSHYRLRRVGEMCFVNIPVDGSSKMPDELMEPLGPWNLDEAVDFNTAYLSGYLADRYDTDSEECAKRALEKAKLSMDRELLKTTAGYIGVREETGSAASRDGTERYALLPVWLMRTEYEGKTWYYAMNGQNGKFVGDLPMDKGKRNRIFIVSALIGGAIGSLLSLLLQTL